MYWPGEVWHGIHVCYCLVGYGRVWSVAHDIVYRMAWRGMARYMVWRVLGMLYGMAWRGLAWYRIWPGGHGMVYDKVWRGMAWCGLCECHALWHCLGLCSRSHVEKSMSVGGPVHTYRANSQIEGPLRACSVHMYSSCSPCALTVN